MTGVRIVLGLIGGAMIIYGAARLLHGLPPALLALLGAWLLGALLIHHGVVSPAIIAVGAALRRVPDRARAFLQGGLIMAGAVSVIAVPLMVRQLSQPPSKAMLLQHYGVNLLVLLAVITAGTLITYAIRVARDRSGSSRA